MNCSVWSPFLYRATQLYFRTCLTNHFEQPDITTNQALPIYYFTLPVDGNVD